MDTSESSDDIKVLFLDIDGVLNHDAQREARKRVPIEHRVEGDWIDPVCVARVQAICDRTGAVIVLSSSWREMVGFDRTLKVLRAKGLTAEVIGQTPTSVPAGKWLVVALTRWQEIQAWLEAHPEVIQYAVLDDDAEGTPEDVYVYTKFSEGITDAHVERAVDLLTTDPNDCGCSMCCGTHVVVNCMGHQRPCDYCDCDIT